jgi:glycosyltransferase involved in cell wall biosynthesis
MSTTFTEIETSETHGSSRTRFTLCHFSTAHTTLKSRSYHMQCKPLADAGIEVHYVSPAAMDGADSAIHFLQWPHRAGRTTILLGVVTLLRTLLQLRADLYHFQDPELLPLAFVMKLVFRKRVIFDCYEDFASMAYTKRDLPRIARPFVASLTGAIQKLAAICFDGIMTADPLTLRRVARSGRSAKLTFYNFPNLDFFPTPRPRAKDFDLVYRGGLSQRAGTWLLLDAMRLLALRGKVARLLLIGYCDNARVENKLRERIRNLGLCDSIQLRGRMEHEEMASSLGRARIGVSPLQDIPKFRRNIPVKIFEYWACSLPVVSSNLPPIRPFFKNVNGGLLFPPGEVEALAQSIEWLLDHPEAARRMGQRGRAAIETRFKHQSEVHKLLKFYSQLAAKA